MSKLNEYKTFDEKNNRFTNGDSLINVNIEKIFQKLEEMNNGDFIFRGISEAKYKMFNSAQRLYLQNELYKQVGNKWQEHYNTFINKLIEKCKKWNQETVKNLLTSANISENNSLAYLSFMQHFGVPTPFLDFTFNPYKALFFAIDNIVYTPSDILIDNYFSIYYTYHNAIIFEGWKNTFNKVGQGEHGNMPYDAVAKNWMNILLPSDEAFKILNNTNIINQEGLFFYNNDPCKPMEDLYFDYAIDVKEKFGQDKFDEMLMHDKFSGCYNIHKSLIPHIKAILSKKGINRDFMYPDINKMRTSILDDAIVDVLTLAK